jgi:hypothetical protein
MRNGLWKVGLLQAIGNAALLWLGYVWLGLGEANARTLSLSVVSMLVFVAGVVLLHGTSLAYFRQPRNSLGRTLLGVARRLTPLMVVAIVSAALYLGLWLWDPKPLVLWVASALTLITQSPIRPAWILRVFETAVMLLRWWVLPMVLVPLMSGIAVHGWRGWREYRGQLRNWRYWLIVPAALCVGAWLPLWLASWTPVRGTFSTEMTSFGIRYAVAYLLFIGAGLALAFATSRGSPELSQESTTASL